MVAQTNGLVKEKTMLITDMLKKPEKEYLSDTCYTERVGKTLHCLTGPAIYCTCTKPTKEIYFISGKELFSKEDWEVEVEEIKRQALEAIYQNLLHCYAWWMVHSSHRVLDTDKTGDQLNMLTTQFESLGGAWGNHALSAVQEALDKSRACDV